MRLVKLSDLTEEERKKALEEQQKRIEQNKQASDKLKQDANNKFNEYVSKNGSYDTNKHTTTLGDIAKAKERVSKESAKEFKKANNMTIWQQVQNIMNGAYQQANKTLPSSKQSKTYEQRKNEYENYVQDKQNAMLNRIATKNYNKEKEEEEKKKKAEIEEKIKKGNIKMPVASATNDVKYLKEQKLNSSNIKNNLDKINLTFEKPSNAIEFSNLDIQAMEDARKKNENIEKGGIDAINEYIDSTLNAIPGGVTATVGGLANVATTGAGFLTKGASKLAGLIGNERLEEKILNGYDKIVETGKYINQKGNYNNNVNSRVENDFTRTSAGVVSTVSQMLTSWAIGAGMGISGSAVQGLSVGGSSAQEVLNENSENIGKATLTGATKGLLTHKIEKLAGGNILGKGSLDDLAVKTISKHFSSKAGQKIASKIYEVGGEVFEENLENALDMVVDNIINKKGYSAKDWWNQVGDTTKNTVLTTIALNLLGVGGNTYNDVKEYALDEQAKHYINEAEKIIKKANLQLDFDKMKEQNQKQSPKLPLNNTMNQNNDLAQQSNQENNEVAQDGISNLMNNNQERYVYEETDNKKVNMLRRYAFKYWDNSEKTRNYVSMLEQIIRDKDIEIRLDANLTDSKGNIANGSYSNGVITINPNSNRKGEFIAIHELTHAIGTQQMINMANKYRKSNLEFNSAVETLLKNYKKSEITEESLADVAGQLFGNQEFINTLSQSNPTLFQKIYNEIKYLWHQFTGYKNQDQFIDDLRYKWEQAYRSNNMLNETTNYSIQRNNNGKYIKVDTDQDIFNGIEEKDYNKIAKMYMQDYLKGSTKLSESDNATIGNKGINKYTNPKQQTKYMNEKMKLTPELKNVLEIAEKVQDSPPTKDTSKYPNWEYYKFNFELGGKNFEGLINIGIDKNGNKHFYEINKIHTTSNSYVSTNKSSSTDSINNSILPTQENVNGTTNNSMQESENNSGSFNLPKIKEGYTRLYRGLENEYKANYDKSKLDNSNGYESWTDSYELAKAYGDNVYYIDVPTSEIKNSIIDEDNTSETYGDRNLLYKNDKPVGIKGKSGNEYMLYTDHDNHINLKYNKVNDNNSMQDNQGRTLTKEQQDYFKDSKIRDANGNLMEVYHGTDNEFNIFDINYLGSASGDVGFLGDGFYFATHKGEAKYYGGKTKSVYLNVTNPFNIKDLKKYNGEQFKGETSNEFLEIKNLVDLNNEWGKIQINSTTYADIKKSVEDYLENVNIKDAGLGEDYYGDETRYWEVTYNGKKDVIRTIPNYTKNDVLADSLNNAMKSKFGFINSSDIIQYITDEKRLNNGKSLQDVLKEKGYDGIIQDKEASLTDEIVVFDSNQIKDVTNKKPSSDPDIRYSLPTKDWDKYLNKNFKTTGTTTNLNEIKYSEQTEHKSLPKPSVSNKKIKESVVNTERALGTTSANLPLSEHTKVRKHYKSIIASQYINDEARKISRELMGTDTYVPESNEKQLERANKTIETAIELNGRAGVDAELNSLMTRAMTKGNIKADDIAVGERLIQYYSKIGDKAKLQDAIQATAMAGTTAGQTVQAMSLLNHQTPEGHAVWLQRSVEKMNNDLKEQRGSKNKEAEQFTLTQDMLEKITNSKDDVELQKNLNEVYSELGQQVSKTTMGKIDSWRYFSMLANVRTHVRNTVGNIAMGITQQAKNKVAGVIEEIASKINPNMERTHTIEFASKEIKEFAKNDIVNVADRLGLNQNKYNPKNRIESNMRTFETDLMENTIGKLFEFNEKALEAEDGWGLKAGYKNALAEYMTANKLDPKNITDKQLAKARNYAVEQAKEATFHQKCELASLISQLSRKNKFAKATTDAILPFVKTPMNVAKAGASYSPVGLAKSIVYDTVQLRKGNINVNQYIDNISKGLTGTGIALVGYALAKSGVLKASGSDDDKKEKYEGEQGKQTYAIQIGDNTYSLDWLAPTGIPLFIGAEIWEMKLNKEKQSASSTDEDSTYNQVLESGTNLLNAMANAMNPMTEMSMLSGLTSALQSYEQGSSQMLASMATNAGKSYINQFVPTALGQIAKTTDKYERSTSSTKQGVLSRAVDSTKNQIMSKVPGLRQKLPTKTDIWGNDIKQADNFGQRALENAVLPYTRKSVSTNDVDKELTRLYDETGESSVLPGVLDKNVTIDGEKYRFTANEYASYKKQYGKESFKMFSDVVRSTSYKDMTDEKKQEVIEKIYTYNKELIKKDYADKNNKEFEPSTMMKTINDIKKNKGNVANYFIYEADTKDMKADKDKDGDAINGSLSGKKAYYIMNTKQFSDADKNAFLKNMTTSENYQTVDDLKNLDNKESIYKYYFKLPKESKESFKSAVKVVKNQSEYVKFKEQEFTADKKNDGTLKGKSISGSKKRKIYEYVNKAKVSYTDRLYMIGTEYKLNKSEKTTLMRYINSLNVTSKEKYDIIKTLKGSTEYKDGSIRY